MMIHEITEKAGKYKARKRIGRGHGSGSGKTSGRGHKGARSRAGFSRRPAFEGGQMPYFRRIPKRGFTNAAFRTVYHIVNVASLEERFKKGATVDTAALVESGLVSNFNNPIKVLGQGELTIKLDVTADKFSATAIEKIEAAGGSVTVIEKKKWVREYPEKPKRKPKKKATPEKTEAPEATEPETKEAPEKTEAPEATEPEVTETSEAPEATEPDATEAEVTEPEATETEVTEAEATDAPEVTEEPEATEAEESNDDSANDNEDTDKGDS
jgi:large subunit ribosomal protein L15